MLDPFDLAYVQRGVLVVGLLAIGAGLLGTWIVLRGLAFFSHAVGTAAFPGLVLADGLGFAAPLGAFAAAVLLALALRSLIRRRGGGQDSLTALVLVGALALGVILASDVFGSGSHIETLLFGSLLLLDSADVALAAAAAAVAVTASLVLGPTWLASGFDPGNARALGVRAGWPDALLLGLIALVSTAALATIGALLTAALLVVPAATVRLWTHRMASWQTGTVGLAALEGIAGLWLAVKTNTPPGAAIALLGGAVFALAAMARALAGTRSLRVAVAGVLLLGAPLFAACGGAGEDTTGDGRVKVVATTTQLGDIAREVGGPAVSVTQILQPNTDPHDYEPRPDDVAATADARIVFTSGDGIDAWMTDVIEQGGGDPRVVDVGAGRPVRLPGEAEGGEAAGLDPHWWHDPRNVVAAAQAMRDALIRADPGRRAAIQRSATAYVARVRALDHDIARCLDRLAPPDRRLVSDHDAFAYFAHRYGLTVLGAVIPAQTTQAQPSAGDLAELSATIRGARVRAVFPESSLSPKLTRAIAEQTGATVGGELYADTLGESGAPGATYLGSEAANARALARGLSGGRVTCSIPAG